MTEYKWAVLTITVITCLGVVAIAMEKYQSAECRKSFASSGKSVDDILRLCNR